MKLFIPKEFIVKERKEIDKKNILVNKHSNFLIKEDIINKNEDVASSLLLNSELGQFLNSSITDLSFNGTDYFVQSNETGRNKIDVNLSSTKAFDLIRQIANVTGKIFSVANPILNVSFGQYRLSAVHPTLAKKEQEGVITFSIRHLSSKILINPNNALFAPKYVHTLLKALIRNKTSMLISGVTGAGKTEFQKYLVSFISDNSKIILIEDTYETFIKELFPNLDVNVWLSNEDSSKMNISDLIKVALRNNPDWIIVAEVRGGEAYDLVQSVSTGHPLLTTIHSENAGESLNRLMILINKHYEIDVKSLMNKLSNSIKIAIHLDKVFDEKSKSYIRYIKEIVEYQFAEELIINKIYSASILNGQLKKSFNPISSKLSKEINVGESWFNSRKELNEK